MNATMDTMGWNWVVMESILWTEDLDTFMHVGGALHSADGITLPKTGCYRQGTGPMNKNLRLNNLSFQVW